MDDLISRQAAQPDTHDTNVGNTTPKNVIYSPVQMAMDYAVNATDFSASSDTISRRAAIDAVSRGCQEFRGIFAECEKNLNELPLAEPEEAIPVAWLEEQAKWFESMDNAFAKIEANNIRVMIKKWRGEKGERSD